MASKACAEESQKQSSFVEASDSVPNIELKSEKKFHKVKLAKNTFYSKSERKCTQPPCILAKKLKYAG